MPRHQWTLEFEDPINAAGTTHVTLFDGDRTPAMVATGSGTGRDGALFDLWSTLADRREDVAAVDHVADSYRVLTGELPTMVRRAH